jgi:hypothetical protein
VDLQSRLSDERGAVTGEAALAIAALVIVTTFLVQALFVGIQYVQLLGLANHAAEIASSSGDPMLRASQAESFVLARDPVLGVVVVPHQRDVTVEIAKTVATFLSWRPELQVESTSRYVDEVME